MRTPALLVSLGIAAVALAGCSDGGAGVTPAENGGLDTGGAGEVVLDSTLLQVNLTPVEPIVIEESGSLSLQQAVVVQDPILGTGSYFDANDRYVVSEALPQAISFHMQANLSWTLPPQTDANAVYMRMEADRDTITEAEGPNYDYPAGTATFTAMLRPSGSGDVTIVVGRNFGGSYHETDTPYDLTITLTPITDRIPGEGVGAITVPAGGELWVEPSHDATGNLFVFDGDDQIHGVFTVTERMLIAGNLTASEDFVLVPPDDDLEPRVLVSVPEGVPQPVLRHLATEILTGPAQDMASGSGTLTFETDRPPLRLGILITGDAGGLHLVSDAEYSVFDPAGEHIYTWGSTGLCGNCWFRGSFGDEAFAPGEYTFEYASLALENAQFQEDLTLYIR